MQQLNADGLIVETESGKVRGAIQNSILGATYYAFKGIPYARPPIGQFRFQVRLKNFPS